MVFVSRFVHTNLSANGAVEVVAATINPGVIGAELDSRDFMCLGNALASVSLFHGVRCTLVFNAQISAFWEVGTVGPEIIVKEELEGGDALRLRDRLTGVALFDSVLLVAASGGCRRCVHGGRMSTRTAAGL